MRASSLLLLACVFLLQTSSQLAMGETAKPSDTNNQPATTTLPPGQTPAPGVTTKAPTPPPGQTPATTKPPTPPPGQTPAPAPTTPKPTGPATTPTPTATNTTTTAPKTPSPTTEEPTVTSEPTPIPIEVPGTPDPKSATTTTTTQSESSSGMGAGAVIGIILACVGLVAIVAFFVYRHFRARREDAKHYGMEYDASSPPMTVLESSRANGYDSNKMYAVLDAPKYAQRPTGQVGEPTETPTDDFVIMTKYATPSSPKFSQNPPQLSPPPFQQDVADFTRSVANFDKSHHQPSSTEFKSSYRESDAESYAGGESYTSGGSYMNSFDHGVSGGFRETLNMEETATIGENGNGDAAAHEAAKDGSHWMEAMDEMRDTNDSYAMLEAGGSYNSRGSAMRFSNESDLRG